MPKKSDIPLQTVTLNLIKGDRETLRDYYPNVSYQMVVRALVQRHCRRLNETANQQGVEDRAITNSLVERIGTDDILAVSGD